MAEKEIIILQDGPKLIPPEFGTLTAPMQKAFDAIDATYVRFLAQFIRQGWKMPKKAYQIVMPNTDDEIAECRADLILRDENVCLIIEKMKKFAIQDFFKAREVVDDALKADVVVIGKGFAYQSDIKDHPTRLKAVEVLNKMSGNNAPEKTENTNKNLSVVVTVRLPELEEDF